MMNDCQIQTSHSNKRQSPRFDLPRLSRSRGLEQPATWSRWFHARECCHARVRRGDRQLARPCADAHTHTALLVTHAQLLLLWQRLLCDSPRVAVRLLVR